MAEIDIKDISSLLRYAADLKKLSENVVALYKHSTQDVDKVHQTWQDAGFERFKSVFDKEMKVLHQLDRELAEFKRHLDRKHGAADKYLKTGF